MLSAEKNEREEIHFSFFCFDSTLFFFFGLTTTMASSEEQWHLRAPVASNPVVFFGE